MRECSPPGGVTQLSADVPVVHKHFGTGRYVHLFGLIGELGKPTLCAANGGLFP